VRRVLFTRRRVDFPPIPFFPEHAASLRFGVPCRLFLAGERTRPLDSSFFPRRRTGSLPESPGLAVFKPVSLEEDLAPDASELLFFSTDHSFLVFLHPASPVTSLSFFFPMRRGRDFHPSGTGPTSSKYLGDGSPPPKTLSPSLNVKISFPRRAAHFPLS